MDEAMKVAETIAGDVAAVALMAAKEAVNRAFETPLAEGMRFERRVFHALFATDDQKEGMAAFVEKRPAKFRRTIELCAETAGFAPGTRLHFRTQITRTTDAFAASALAATAAPERRHVIAPRGNCGSPRPARRAAVAPGRRRAGDHRRLQHHHAGEAALRIERGGAGEAERRRGFERERVGDARLRGADRAAAALRLRIGDADQRHVAPCAAALAERRPASGSRAVARAAARARSPCPRRRDRRRRGRRA